MEQQPIEHQPSIPTADTRSSTLKKAVTESVTWRAIVLGIVLTLVFGIWVRQAEIVVCACQITESVPAIPGVAALILLIFLNPLIARSRIIRPLTRGEILTTFLFVTVALSMAGCGVVRFLLALVSGLVYYATPESGFQHLVKYAPPWLVPRSKDVIQRMYQGPGQHGSHQVPWDAWAVPLLMWTLFFVLLWVTLVCILILLRRSWAEKEHLMFPLVFWPLEMTETHGNPMSVPAFFRSKAMWIGFGIAAAYNLVNILHAFYPTLPEIKSVINFGAGTTYARPWNAFLPVNMIFRPDLIGIGFLVSTEICFSIWFFYLFTKFESLALTSMGVTKAGIPFVQEQSMGAYLAMLFVLIFLARSHLIPVFRYILFLDKQPPPGNDEEVLSYRRAFWGAVLGFTGLVIFCRAAGMATWVAVMYLALVVAVAIVYARIRAETGVPLIWLFPFYMQKRLMLYGLGSAPFMEHGGPQTVTMLAMLTFLSRGYFPSLAAYQLEAFKLAKQININLRQITGALLLAVVVGTLVAFYYHLTPYYAKGALSMRGGIWGYSMAIDEFKTAATYQKMPVAHDLERMYAASFGGMLTVALSLLRLKYLDFPLHPLGFAMATAYGDLIWFPFLLVWCLKFPIVRYGGNRLYKRLVPGFLGFALGHFFMAGIVWGLLGSTGKDLFLRYGVWFG